MDPIEIPTYAPDLMPGYDPTVIRPLQGAGVVGFVRPDILTNTGGRSYLSQSAYGIPITEIPNSETYSLDQADIPNPDFIQPGETPYTGETYYSRDLLVGHTMFTEAPQLYIKPDRAPEALIVSPITALPEPELEPQKRRIQIPVEIVGQPESAPTPKAAPTSLTVKYSSAPK